MMISCGNDDLYVAMITSYGNADDNDWKVGSDLPLPTLQLRRCSNPIIYQLNKTGGDDGRDDCNDDDCDDCDDDDCDDCDEDDCDDDHDVDNHGTKVGNASQCSADKGNLCTGCHHTFILVAFFPCFSWCIATVLHLMKWLTSLK